MTDYEKKYNEALNWMRELYPGLHGATKEDAEHYFPELAESEDERMLNTIIRGFENWKGNGNMLFNNTDVDDILAYLEKQKEQKQTDLPAGFYYIDLDGKKYYSKEFRYGDMKLKVGEQKPAWSEEDEKMLDDICSHLYATPEERGKMQNWLKSLRPQPKQMPADWTDKDKRILDDISHLLISFRYTEMAKAYKQAIEKLIYQPHWKPSEEQIEALAYAIQLLDDGLSPKAARAGEELESLREQLKKL